MSARAKFLDVPLATLLSLNLGKFYPVLFCLHLILFAIFRMYFFVTFDIFTVP